MNGSRAARRRGWPAAALAAIMATTTLAATGAGATEPAGAEPAAPRDPAPATPAVSAAEPVEELLYVSEGNRLRRFDLDSVGTGDLVEDVLIERRASDPDGLDINGTICGLPDGSGRFIASEDTGQPLVPAGYGVFEADGTQVGKLSPTSFVAGSEPTGCAFAPDGTLFTSEVGAQGFGTANGQLMMWFPPYDVFPGDPGTYPNGEYSEGNYCKLAVDLGTANGVAVDHLGRVYAAESSGLRINRFSPPFPTSATAAGGCGSTDALGSPFADQVDREVFAAADAATGMVTFSALAISPAGTLYAGSVLTGHIGEYDLDGNLLRVIVDPPNDLPSATYGHPMGMAFDSRGTLYYADLDLRGTLPNVGPGPDGKVWRVRFDALGNPREPEVVRTGLAFPDGLGVLPGDLGVPAGSRQPTESRTYAGGPERRFLFDDPYLDAQTAPTLREKWRFSTDAIITGSPAVAGIDLPGEGIAQVVYFSSWDGHVYAARFDDGSELWRAPWPEQPGATFPGAASVHVEDVDGVDLVIAAGGQTVTALDAIDGTEVWVFEAGTGCRDDDGNPPGLCGFGTAERNEVESSPIVADGKVFFGMDVNESVGGKGGFYAVDVRTGTLAWYFDVTTGATCTPFADDEIRNFDGYHTAEQLGLPEDFFATRPGCDHPREPNGCGSVWSSPALDAGRGQIYFGTSNCYTSDDPTSPRPAPPMPDFDEALVALDLDGSPAWRWRPRDVDNDDLAFGAVPNLFSIDVDGIERDVVGIGNKDGSYTVVDRDGVNVRNGVTWESADANAELPYWRTRVVPGGAIGGVIATASVDESNRRVRFSTGPGQDVLDPQRPTVHVLDLDTGAVVWQNVGATGLIGDASYSPTSGTPSVLVTGSVLAPSLRIFDAASGDLLFQRLIGAPGALGGIGSGAVIVDGTLLVGHGIGARSANPNSQGNITSRLPSDLVALCVPGAPDCDDEPTTFTARFSEERCAVIENVASALGYDSPADLIRTGVRGGIAVAESGDATPVAKPPANDGPCEITVEWPAEEAAAVSATATAFGIDEGQLNHLGGVIVLAFLSYAIRVAR